MLQSFFFNFVPWLAMAMMLEIRVLKSFPKHDLVQIDGDDSCQYTTFCFFWVLGCRDSTVTMNK